MRIKLQTTNIETIVREEVQNDPLLEEALQLYQQEKEHIAKINGWWEKKAYAFQLPVPTLSPTEIALFCQNEEQHDAFSYYLNSLIQKSYKEGNNNFTLTFNIPHDDLLSQVQGTKEQPLKITINSNTKDYCAYESKHLNLTINGNTGNNCAYGSEHLNLTINGNTGENSGLLSKNTTITINGTIGEYPSTNPTYTTNNQETYEYLKKNNFDVTLR